MSYPAHLLRRWWRAVWASAPPSATEVWVERWLTPQEYRMWRRLDDRDRAHAVDVAQRFLRLRPEATRPEMAAALLHDCGKVEAHLSTVQRVVATVVGPRTERFRRYHEHERLGAAMLADIGSHPVTVALVAGSPEAPADALQALMRADDV